MGQGWGRHGVVCGYRASPTQPCHMPAQGEGGPNRGFSTPMTIVQLSTDHMLYHHHYIGMHNILCKKKLHIAYKV